MTPPCPQGIWVGLGLRVGLRVGQPNSQGGQFTPCAPQYHCHGLAVPHNTSRNWPSTIIHPIGPLPPSPHPSSNFV